MSLLWGLFHIFAIPSMIADMVTAAGGASPGVDDLASFNLLFNACMTAFLLGIGVVFILGRASVRSTLLGKALLIMMSLFWLVRLIAPYFLLPQGVSAGDNISPFDIVFLAMAVLYCVPLLLKEKPKTTELTPW